MKIESPAHAAKLARAIVSDLILYNEAAIVESFTTGQPLASLAELLGEGRDLYRSRVDPSLAKEFAATALPMFESWGQSRGYSTANLARGLATALGEPVAEPAAPPTFAPAPRPLPVASAPVPMPAVAAIPAVAAAPTAATRLAARSGIDEGALVLLPRKLRFESARAGVPIDEISLDQLAEVQVRRAYDKTHEVMIGVGYQQRRFTIVAARDAITLVQHVLPALEG